MSSFFCLSRHLLLRWRFSPVCPTQQCSSMPSLATNKASARRRAPTKEQLTYITKNLGRRSTITNFNDLLCFGPHHHASRRRKRQRTHSNEEVPKPLFMEDKFCLHSCLFRCTCMSHSVSLYQIIFVDHRHHVVSSNRRSPCGRTKKNKKEGR